MILPMMSNSHLLNQCNVKLMLGESKQFKRFVSCGIKYKWSVRLITLSPSNRYHPLTPRSYWEAMSPSMSEGWVGGSDY